MLRKISVIMAGLAVFAALEFIATQVAISSWPEYALASPSRNYTVGMLLVRLTAGACGAFAAGAVAARLYRESRQGPFLFGVALFLISAVWHIIIWSQYPVWYHLVWLGCIIPSSVLGGRLIEQRTSRRTAELV
jgi:hypothetical protein